jgi:two-component system CheB/CheR fusion protein
LEQFFDAMPPESGMAFVVVQHLSPDFRSVMDEILAHRTRIPIHRVVNGMPVQANAIYLMPPKKEMIISGGRLLLTDKDPTQALTLPIDHFFRSLAHDVGRNAIAVVLSGTGSDGSRGIRDVHEAGGMVIAQSRESAKFDGMPKSTIDSGLTDLVLAPEAMPAALLKHAQHPLAESLSQSVGADGEGSGMSRLFQLLRDQYGIDFSQYKPSTVGRRIERRLLMQQVGSLDEYVDRLTDDPEELDSLYKDLLIGVTKFFRDPEAFRRLEQDLLPDLLRQTPANGEFRVWIPGCATGEEAYSLAILIREALEALDRPVDVKIFATDVHRASIDTASAGVYS